MFRKGKIISLALIVCMAMATFVSCGIGSLADVDFDTYGDVEVTEDGCIIYQGKKYYPTPTYLFDITHDVEKDVELGWYVNVPFSGGAYYFSNTYEDPIYIYCNVGAFDVWIREDFDYTSDIFTIADTDIEILFSKAFTDNKVEILSLDVPEVEASFRWHSKTVPALQIRANIVEYNDTWYMQTLSLEYWEISSEFLNLLIENKIINVE